MQITKQVDKTIIDLKNASVDDLVVFSQILLDVSDVVSNHGLIMTIRTIPRTPLDLPRSNHKD